MGAIARWAVRLGGAGMLGATAGIHADLYQGYGYKHIDRIGPLFLLLIIGASILCLAVLVAPQSLLGLVALAGALTELATAVSLLILTHHTLPGLKGFTEGSSAPHYSSSLIVEFIGVALLGALAVTAWGPLRRRSPSPS
jgi:hypothetical protein